MSGLKSTAVPKQLEKRFVSPKVAGEMTGLKDATIRQYVAKRKFAHARFGRAIRIPLDELERFIDESMIPAKAH